MRVWDPQKNYEILVRHFEGGAVLNIYTGPWGQSAQKIWENAGKEYYSRRARRHVSDRESQATLYGHPDLVELDEDVDAMELERFYDDPEEAS